MKVGVEQGGKFDGPPHLLQDGWNHCELTLNHPNYGDLKFVREPLRCQCGLDKTTTIAEERAMPSVTPGKWISSMEVVRVDPGREASRFRSSRSLRTKGLSLDE